MMRDWRLWIVARGRPMHEGTRTKCGLRNRSAIKKCSRISGNIDIEPGGKLHEQVMRVLPIDQWLPIGNFAGGKEIGIAIVPHFRFKAHRSEENTSELKSIMRRSYAVFFLTTKT